VVKDATIFGRNLSSATTVEFYSGTVTNPQLDSGVVAHNLKPSDDGRRLVLDIEITAGAALGAHGIKVVTLGGSAQSWGGLPGGDFGFLVQA
jgi:hypothetical protein